MADYIADYQTRRMMRADCLHGAPLAEPCGACEHEIAEGEGLGLSVLPGAPWVEDLEMTSLLKTVGDQEKRIARVEDAVRGLLHGETCSCGRLQG